MNSFIGCSFNAVQNCPAANHIHRPWTRSKLTDKAWKKAQYLIKKKIKISVVKHFHPSLVQQKCGQGMDYFNTVPTAHVSVLRGTQMFFVFNGFLFSISISWRYRIQWQTRNTTRKCLKDRKWQRNSLTRGINLAADQMFFNTAFLSTQVRPKQRTHAVSTCHSWALWAVCHRTLFLSVRWGHIQHTGAQGPQSTCEAEALFYCSTCHRSTFHIFGSDAERERMFYLFTE